MAAMHSIVSVVAVGWTVAVDWADERQESYSAWAEHVERFPRSRETGHEVYMDLEKTAVLAQHCPVASSETSPIALGRLTEPGMEDAVEA